MDIPLPFVDGAEMNETVKKIHGLCVQGRRAYMVDLMEVEKKAILALLQEGKRAVDAYYKAKSEGNRGAEILKGLDMRLVKVETNIATQKLEAARLQTLTDSTKARLEISQANAERLHHSARAAALEHRQLASENAKLELEVKSATSEWSGLLNRAEELSQRFHALCASSPKLQNRNREAEVIDSLRKKCDDLEEEKAQLTEREEYCRKEVDCAQERGFSKFARGVAKFILKEKMHLESCFKQYEEIQELLKKQAQKRAMAAAGQIDPMDATFADFDETVVYTNSSPQRTRSEISSQGEMAASQTDHAKTTRPLAVASEEKMNGPRKDGPFLVPAAVRKQAAPKRVTDVMDTDDSAASSGSDPRSCSSSSLSSSDLCMPNPAPANPAARSEAPPARRDPAPPKRDELVAPTPVVVEPLRAVSPVMESPPDEPVEEEALENAVDESMTEESAAVQEQEAMDVGTGANSDAEDDRNNNSFQFEMSPTGDNGVSNFFDSSQIQDVNNMDTEAVLNISRNSNDPGGDFLAMMQGNRDKDKEGGSADNNFSFGMMQGNGDQDKQGGDTEFSFGGMFGGSDNGNDAAGGGNDFAFDFNAGGSSPGDHNNSFSFNFGGGDNSSNNDAGDDGAFFFPF